MGLTTIWMTLHDMSPENGPGIVSPAFDEVIASLGHVGFACATRPGHVPDDGLAASFTCTSDSLDVFDLLEVLIWSGAVFTLIAPRAGTVSMYMGCYALDVVEIEGAPLALLDAKSDDDAYALLNEWVKTQPYTDAEPPVGYSPQSVVVMLHHAWAGKIKRDRFVVTAEQVDGFASAAAEFREGWSDWVAARRGRAIVGPSL
ncbi:MAG TPA: hypothetical protein VM347_33280 [Nonomuraea sp.]|nr:hypothetical protein [Nonomuraea sp.]